MTPKIKIDEKALSRKYRTNVPRLIQEWKKGTSDLEISKEMGIDLFKVQQIKADIELTHRRLRMAGKKASTQDQTYVQRHIFLSPFT